MKKIVIILSLSLFFSSCVITAPQGGYLKVGYTHFLYNNFNIEIISDPAGAVIEWDNQYMGVTPLTIPMTGKMGNAITATIKATPKISGQYVQYKVLRNPLPSKIYFNMKKDMYNNYKSIFLIISLLYQINNFM